MRDLMLSVNTEAKSILRGEVKMCRPTTSRPRTLFETPAARLGVTKAEPAERGHVSKKNSLITAN
jgi:hypothetical protein